MSLRSVHVVRSANHAACASRTATSLGSVSSRARLPTVSSGEWNVSVRVCHSVPHSAGPLATANVRRAPTASNVAARAGHASFDDLRRRLTIAPQSQPSAARTTPIASQSAMKRAMACLKTTPTSGRSHLVSKTLAPAGDECFASGKIPFVRTPPSVPSSIVKAEHRHGHPVSAAHLRTGDEPAAPPGGAGSTVSVTLEMGSANSILSPPAVVTSLEGCQLAIKAGS